MTYSSSIKEYAGMALAVISQSVERIAAEQGEGKVTNNSATRFGVRQAVIAAELTGHEPHEILELIHAGAESMREIWASRTRKG